MKNVITFLLVTTLSISLCACGSKEQPETYESVAASLESQAVQDEGDMSVLKEEKEEKEEPVQSLSESDKEDFKVIPTAEPVEENVEEPLYVVPEGYSYITKDNVTYEAGETLHEIDYEARLIGEDYIYEYVLYWESDDIEPPSGWKVSVVDKSRSSYPDIEAQMGIPVVSLEETFRDCKKLAQAPAIPDTVRTMKSAFGGCESLTKFEDFPPNVENISYTFKNCIKLTDVGSIPEGVTLMGSTFSYCTSLKKAPALPSTLTTMYSVFSQCSALEEAPVIPESVEIMGTVFVGCKALKTAPVIPKNVVEMNGVFANCTSLTGDVIVHANPKSYADCFYEIDFTKQNLTLSGDSLMLEALSQESGK